MRRRQSRFHPLLYHNAGLSRERRGRGYVLDEGLQSDHVLSILRLLLCITDILPALSHEYLRAYFAIAAFGQQVRLLATTAISAAAAVDSLPAVEPTLVLSQRNANLLDLVLLHAAPLLAMAHGRTFAMEKLDHEAERRAITSSLLANIRTKDIHVRFDVATTDTLRTLMTAWKCRVLQFSGHGMGRSTELCFEDGSGCAHMIKPDLLRRLMFSDEEVSRRLSDNRPSVQLVFVNACHSQRVASVFIDIGIPHVVAVRKDFVKRYAEDSFMNSTSGAL